MESLRKSRLVSNAPVATLAALVTASVALLLALSWRLTFYQDTWAFLMTRRGDGVGDFLRPHNEHIVLIPVAIEKLLLGLFGMSTARPEYVLMTLLLAAAAVLVFVYVRRRLGPWPATMAAAIMLFLGPAWAVLLWPFEIGFVGSVLAGVGMLLALDREDDRGDALASVLLALSLGFSSLGLSFVVAGAVDLWQQRRSRGRRRAYIVAAPLFLYLVWYAGWGHTAERHLTLHNIAGSPLYLMNGLASSLDTVLGLSTVPIEGVGQPHWGRPLLVAAIVLLAIRQSRSPGVSRKLWPVLAATLTYWLLAAVNYIPSREATSSRYAYAGAVFVLLLAAELIRRSDLNARRLWIAGAVVAAAVLANLVPLREGQKFLEEQTVLTRADTGAIEIARRTVSPEFQLGPAVAGTGSLIDVDAADYLQAVGEYGSPAYSPQELAQAPEAGRRQADVVLAQALPVSLAASPRQPATAGGTRRCVELPGEGVVTLQPGRTAIQVAPGPSASLALRRFAEDGFPVGLGTVPGGSTSLLTIPPDMAKRQWQLLVQTSRRARVCGIG